MTEANKDVARRWLEEVWNRGDAAAVRELVAPDFVRHDPELHVSDAEAYGRLVAAYRAAFADLRFTCEDLVAEGDKVLVRWKAHATLRGATQELDGADLLRVSGGRIAEGWPLFDGLRLLRKMGLLRFVGLVRRLRRATRG